MFEFIIYKEFMMKRSPVTIELILVKNLEPFLPTYINNSSHSNVIYLHY